MSKVQRPSRVVMVDADNPMEEIHEEFVWLEDHERALTTAQDAAYRAGYQDALAASSAASVPGTVRVRVQPRPRLVFRALILLVVLAYVIGLVASLLR